MKPFKRIYVEITNICNLSCSFCPQTRRSKQFLSVTQFEYIIRQAAQYSDHIYFHVKGEPLLHPELSAFLELCHEHRLKVNLTTNGTLIRETMEVLMHAPALRQLSISLHSFESERRPNASLESYIEEIITSSLQLQSSTNTIIALRLWNLDKNNIQQSIKLQNKYILEKLEEVFRLPFSISEHFLQRNESSLGKNNLLPKGLKLSDRIFLNQSFEFMWPHPDAPSFGTTGYCYGLKDQLAILSDGTVVPCCLDGDGYVALGNIFEHSLTDILTNERAQSIKNGFACRTIVEDLCKHCGYRTRFDR